MTNHKNNIKTIKIKGESVEYITNPYISPQYDKNEERYGHEGCHCCRKPIKDDSKANFIHMTTHGHIVDNKINDEDLSGSEIGSSQGSFPVGPENFLNVF